MQNKDMHEEKVRSAIEKMAARYIERSPFYLNPDKVVVKNIITGLTMNKMKHGYAYCPCREVKGILEINRKNICPCQTHKEEIATQGTCECGLFVSKTYKDLMEYKSSHSLD